MKKKIFAKEFLLFISTGILCGILVLGMYSYFEYLDSQKSKLENVAQDLNQELDSLPTDVINNMYKTIVDTALIELFELQDSFHQRNQFISFIKANKLNSSTYHLMIEGAFKDYWEFKHYFGPNVEIIFYNDNVSDGILSQKEFSELIKRSSFVNFLYFTLKDKYDLGEQERFQNKIEEGFRYDPSTEKSLLDLIQTNNKELEKIKAKLHSETEYYSILRWVLAIIALLVYPIRGLFYSIKWSIKTLKDAT